MDLRQLAIVIAIVDEGGFTSAADALELSQPSVSQAVRALEVELGVELFHRSGRTVRLTAAGEALIGPARQAVRDAATARAAVAAVAGVDAGHLDLVSLPTLAMSPAADLIGRFRRAHPGVTVRLAEPDDPAAIGDWLRTGQSEIGIAELPLAGDDLESHPLATQDFVALLPPELGGGAPIADGPVTHITLRALADQPLITTPPGTSTRRQTDDAFAARGLTPNIAVETDHREVIVSLVLAGAGVSILPRPVAVAAVDRGAVVRELRPRVTRLIGLVHRRGTLSPAAQAFLGLAIPDLPSTTERPPARRR
ncbi:MAG: LysR family transcriptional regulator [Acidimicrobiales bacterium]